MNDRSVSYNIKPTLSVIIPCYNATDTIVNTLNSLERQKYKDFEAIVINDGSTDNLDEIIREYTRNSDITINYIKQNNGGVSVARNTGLDNAKGQYIVFLDADDVYHCNFISSLYETLNKLNVDTVYCLFSRDIKKLSIEEDDGTVSCVERLSANEVMLNFMYKPMPMGFSTFIYKKSILEDNNIRFTPNVKYGEDLEFAWKYLPHCSTGAAIKKPLYGYYDNPKSAINTVNWGKTDLLASIARVEDYLREVNSPFYETYKDYMYARTIWAVSKTFAQAGKKEMFDRLNTEYHVKEYMKMLNKAPDKRIAVSSWLYRINPGLFYWAVRKRQSI